MENSFHFFPLWKRGMKGDLTAFQKAKLLQKKKDVRPLIWPPGCGAARFFFHPAGIILGTQKEKRE
jgi:hypothetical protein